ncbi:MAG TPA: amidase, partial [Candidatus Margulisiibacteriota bacterium]|nr:amidase [Candidatus Margulisiibacteriota bacterium]
MSDAPEQHSATELLALLARRQVSAVELAHAFLSRIERLDPRINSYITVTADAALRDARRL